MQWAAFRSSRKRIELGKFNIIQFLVEVSSIRINTQGDLSHPGFLADLVIRLEGDLHGLVGTGGDAEFTGYALIVVKGDPHIFSLNRECPSGTDRGAGGALDALIFVPLDILGQGFDIQP
jgi:hypothetical protein